MFHPMTYSDPAPADAEATALNLDLLTAHERLERLGRPLNAVVSVADAPERAATGPLAGRPVAVKDIIAVKGLPTRCGSPATSAEPAAEDAPLVAALRAAGAEVFATTQCLEFAAGFAHPAVGGTRNPRDPSRTAGGSSGGSAALVAAGVCDLAIGTDTGGSIRIPAAYCGVVGLKPTYGLVPVGGVFPLSPSLDHAGTLTRTAGDAIALLRAVAAPAPGDPAPGDLPPGTVPVIGLLASQVADESVGEEVRLGVRQAIDLLTAAGWIVREIRPPWTGEPQRWERALAVIVAREAAGSHAGRDTSQYADGTRALLESGARVTDAEYAAARADQAELARAVGRSLAGVDVLAGPTVGYCAPAEDPPFGAQ
jgi:Asp-tRNA(Asn)/Glu-tRNA(Gln) amidotransferase A subunit family amidase